MKLHDILSEAGLSRVNTHLRRPFAVLTSFRDGYTLKQNRRRNKSLEAALKQNKMGGIKLEGHWQEAPDGMDWKTAVDQGLTEEMVEESYFVPMPRTFEEERFKHTIQHLTYSFNQDAAVYSDGKDIYLLFKHGKLDKIGSGVSFGKIGQGYSRLRNKPNNPFVFE